MPTTARDFITLALKEAGVLGIGQTANAEDINDCFVLLNRMLSQWQKKRWIVPNLVDIYAPGNSSRSNLIGPGQYYNYQRPDKIQAAYFKQLNSGSNNVSYPLTPIWSYEDYSRIALKELNSWPSYFFYDAAFPYGNVFIWPIPTSQYEVHLIVKGPIGFTIQLEDGVIETAGTGYTAGDYNVVPFINISSFGSEGTANVVVDETGFISSVTIFNGGNGYKINDTLSFNVNDIGGTGDGLVWKVTNVTDSLDAEFNMPPEYEEAIHYNLCVRIVSMYQLPINPVQGKLAVLALNTIRNANSQISRLQMPSSLKFGNGGAGWYIFNADQY